MRPVRFVALSEDGQALVLADEVGRLLTLPIDDRVATLLRPDRTSAASAAQSAATRSVAGPARHPGPHPLRRVGRGRGPHRRRTGRPRAALRRPGAAGAGDARPARPPHPAAHVGEGRLARPRSSTPGSASTASTWRRSPGTPTAATTARGASSRRGRRARPTRPRSGSSTRPGSWSRRRTIWPTSCAARRPGRRAPRARGRAVRPEPSRGGHEPMVVSREPARPNRDPIRTGRDALLASLERPLGTPSAYPWPRPDGLPAASVASAAASGEVPRRRSLGRSAMFEDERENAVDVPAVPSLAVLRPRRSGAEGNPTDRPVKRGPSWDDVLFGAAPTAKDA